MSDILYNIDSSTLILGAVFLIVFAIIFFSTSRVFKDQHGNPNRAIAGLISFAISLLIIYGINRSGFDFEYFLYNLGFTEGLVSVLVPIVLIAGAIFI